jgi:hypothetical protein
LRSCCLRALATASVAFIRPSSVPWLPGAGGGRLGRRRSRRHKRAKMDRNKSITKKKIRIIYKITEGQEGGAGQKKIK